MQHLKTVNGDALKRVGRAAMIGFAIVGTFAVIDSVANVRSEGSMLDNAALYALLLLLSTGLVYSAERVLGALHVGSFNSGSYIAFGLRVTTTVVIAILWTSLLADQMPCMIGSTNCD